jgi:hypothetical protein
MRILFILITLCLVCSSCNDSNKISIGNQLDVYYKGKGVKEEDARRLGEFLVSQGYSDSASGASVELSKDSSWLVKLVVKKEQADPSNQDMRTAIAIMQEDLRDSVFNGEATRVTLADEDLNEFKLDTLGRHSKKPE